MADGTMEISVKGKWVQVPALQIDGTTVVVQGDWLKVAAVHDEMWMESEIEDPEAYIKRLRVSEGERNARRHIHFHAETAGNNSQVCLSDGSG